MNGSATLALPSKRPPICRQTHTFQYPNPQSNFQIKSNFYWSNLVI